MFMRLAPFFFTFLLVMSATPSRCEQKLLKLRLSYTTVHGGLRIAVSPEKKNLPKLGLALAGGGAKAAASIGVLKVLEKEGIPVSAIAGTSMGAGVGGLFAAGYSPGEIARIFLGNDWNDIFTDTPRRAFMTQEQKEAGALGAFSGPEADQPARIQDARRVVGGGPRFRQPEGPFPGDRNGHRERRYGGHLQRPSA
jgi:hypothetical protein